MRLGKKFKVNMIIAILLCMAFVVNIGGTLAATTYAFIARSAQDSNKKEIYTEYNLATGATGEYVYSTGINNNQLSIDYGFSAEYDLMVEFTASYSTASHVANDFALNFVNRDNWCIDMDVMSGSSSTDSGGNTVAGKQFYSLTADSSAGDKNTISGVMYYMQKVSGSGSMPIISGVEFYTSPNNSYSYVGDVLTVTLTPHYVKSDAEKYEDITKHAFNGMLLNSGNSTALQNWASYMDGSNNSLKVMTYNAYVNNSNALQYPSDYDWSVKDANGDYTFDLTAQSAAEYSNTAYKYSVSNNGTTVNGETTYKVEDEFATVIAGNKYYGGLGVYVIPSSASQNPVEIVIDYKWQKNNVIDNVATNMVRLEYSSDISVIGTGHYSSSAISGPTYINILDHIMLTAESPYLTLLQEGYGLVITNVTATLQASTPADWSSVATGYEISNSTSQSPTLVRIKEVADKGKTYDANISIMNNTGADMAITGFTVSAKLWYSSYTSGFDANSNPVVSAWKEIEIDGEDYRPTALIYDDVWTVTPGETDLDDDGQKEVSFRFARADKSVYIPNGYSIQLVKGIEIPEQYYPVSGDFSETVVGSGVYHPINVHDLWCSLYVTNVVTTTEGINYTQTTYNRVETSTDGYYSFVEAGATTDIYVRNNTSQNITGVTLSRLTMAAPKSISDQTYSATAKDRDNIDTSITVNYTVTYFNKTTAVPGAANTVTGSAQSILIRPNETILLCSVKPTTKALISEYKVTCTMQTNANQDDVDLVFNSMSSTANIINNSSEKYYEFRISTTSDISTKLAASIANDFETFTSGGKNYLYYVGVICPNQCIALFSDIIITESIIVEYVEHVANGNSSYYDYTQNADTTITSNYSSTTFATGLSTDWLDAMKNIYSAPAN